MSTNAIIMMKVKETNEVKGISCHWDGYPEWVGEKLIGYHNTYEKACDIMKLGNLSALGETLDPKPADEKGYNNKYTEAYMRDMGRTNEEEFTLDNVPKTASDLIAAPYSWNFAYLYKDDAWYVVSNQCDHSEFIPMVPGLSEDDFEEDLFEEDDDYED